MKLLVLGGTRFVGRAIVEAALEQGHTVTVFHRGRHAAAFSRGVESLHGDRRQDLSVLTGKTWDRVIDTSGYTEHDVRSAVERLSASAGHYTFVSTISVYADYGRRGITEESPVQPPESGSREVTGETYGPMKVAAEESLRHLLPDRHLIVRPGIIVGPEDYTDRFPFLCRRVAAGGQMLCPGEPDRPVQWIDVRDLGAWLVAITAGGAVGTFNATGPASPATLETLLAGIRSAAGSDTSFIWVDQQFLTRNGFDPARGFPFFVPAEHAGLFGVDSTRAKESGLEYRPLSGTVRDTLAWDARRPAEERRTWLSPEREQQLLEAWRAR